jgi:hypothetical protein
VLAASEELSRDARKKTLVRLASDRLEGERAAAGRVVADRRHAALVDRQLQP